MTRKCLLWATLVPGLAAAALFVGLLMIWQSGEDQMRLKQAICGRIKPGMTEKEVDAIVGTEGCCFLYGSIALRAFANIHDFEDGSSIVVSYCQDVVSGPAEFIPSRLTIWDRLKRKATRAYYDLRYSLNW